MQTCWKLNAAALEWQINEIIMNSLKPKTAHTASKIAEKMPTHGSFRGIEWMGLAMASCIRWNGMGTGSRSSSSRVLRSCGGGSRLWFCICMHRLLFLLSLHWKKIYFNFYIYLTYKMYNKSYFLLKKLYLSNYKFKEVSFIWKYKRLMFKL